MQVSFLTFTALIVLVSADLHHNGLCVNNEGGADVFNLDATIKACQSYKNRNTGTKQWDTCPDCAMNNDASPFCYSPAEHIGGDEITHYCKQHGADNALTS